MKLKRFPSNLAALHAILFSLSGIQLYASF